MSSTEITTTNIGKVYQRELKRLAKMWGVSQVSFLNRCIEYFKYTGINPSTETRFSPKEEIAKLQKRLDQVIGVISKHEKDNLRPLLDEISITSRRINQLINEVPGKDDLEELKENIITKNKNSIDSNSQKLQTEIQDLINMHQKSNDESLNLILNLITTQFNALQDLKILGSIKDEYKNTFNQLNQK